MFSYKGLLYTSVMLLVLAVGWRMSSAPAAAEGDEKEKAAPPPAAGEDAPPRSREEVISSIPSGALEDGVILQSGDVKVMLAAVEKTQAAYEAANKNGPQPKMTPEFERYLRKRMAFDMLMRGLLEKYVADNKLVVAPEKFQAEFEKFKTLQKQQYNTEYPEFLAQNGLTDEECQRALKSSVAIDEKFAAAVTDNDVTQWLAEPKNSEQLPLRRASHILFMHKEMQGAPPTATRTKDEAKAAAEEIVKKIKAGGDFAELAKASSDCPSKQEGGDLNYFPRHGVMVEQFAAAAYALAKAGDVTGVVETPFGYHVIKLTELRTIEDMKPEIKKYLTGKKAGLQIQKVVEAGMAKAKYNEKLIPKEEPKPKDLNLFPGQDQNPK